MRFCFLLERGKPPRQNPIMEEVFELLRGRGAAVDILYAEEELIRLDSLKVDADLYLLKSDSELSLSLATAFDALGGLVLNPVKACILAKDKLLAAAVMAGAGLPAPHSFASFTPSQLSAKVSKIPLILKPPRGYHGAGIKVTETAAVLPPDSAFPDFTFAQEYLAGARKDLKIFGIGDEIFGVRKAFSEDSFTKAGEPCSLTPTAESAARQCARAFGLKLYGIDLAENDDGVSVIDVNYFPGYRGVPGAARRIADYIYERAKKG